MMKGAVRIGFALSAVLLFGCRAPDPSAPTANQTEAEVQAHPALWMVSDADTQIYIFGTVHSLPTNLQWQTGEVKQAMSKAGTLVLELSNPDDPAEATLVFNRLSHSKGLPPIESRVAPELRPRLAEAAKTAGLSLSTLSTYESWAAALVLSKARTQKAGYERGAGVEAGLIQAFRSAGKPIEGLESFTQQFGYFDVLPEAEQRTMLANTLADPGKSEAQLDEAVDAWADGEPDRLAATMNRETDATPVLKRLLLTDRNARWALWINKALDRPGVILVAVGAGHLAGEGSVQQMLSKRGLKVVRIQ